MVHGKIEFFLQFVSLTIGTVEPKPNGCKDASISEWNISDDLFNTKNHTLISRNPYCFIFFGHWSREGGHLSIHPFSYPESGRRV